MFKLTHYLVPIVIFLMLLSSMLESKKNKGDGEEPSEQDTRTEEEKPRKKKHKRRRKKHEEFGDAQPDLAAEFERRLKKSQQADEESFDVRPARTDGQRVHTDSEVVHDSKGRVHTDSELAHDSKGRVHTDSELAHDSKGRVHTDYELAHDSKGRVRTDDEFKHATKERVYSENYAPYAYRVSGGDDDERTVRPAAIAAQELPVRRSRVRLRHPGLVQGFIMSQVLAKPRALRPYEQEEQL
jgi:hypothetical protein